MEVNGKILLEEKTCPNCGGKFFGTTISEVSSCKECGARYKVISFSTDLEYQVTVEYEMAGFLCMEQGYFDKCEKCCPAPYMYCQKHSSEDAIQKAKDNIDSAKRSLEKAKNKLERIEESRKNWIITDISGINSDEKATV